MTTSFAYEVRRAGPRIGAEIVGLDLNRDVDDATARRLRRDFRDYGDRPRAYQKVIAAHPETSPQSGDRPAG